METLMGTPELHSQYPHILFGLFFLYDREARDPDLVTEEEEWEYFSTTHARVRMGKNDFEACKTFAKAVNERYQQSNISLPVDQIFPELIMMRAYDKEVWIDEKAYAARYFYAVPVYENGPDFFSPIQFGLIGGNVFHILFT